MGWVAPASVVVPLDATSEFAVNMLIYFVKRARLLSCLPLLCSDERNH